MADLSAYVDFSVLLDKSGVTPAVILTDTSAYPAGVNVYITGVFSITQPDGLAVVGNFITPDVSWNGSALSTNSKELRLATDGSFQNGIYSITYTVKATGYTDTVKTKTFDLDYTASTVIITPLMDVFTPSLQVVDSTVYKQAGFTVSSTTRAWSASIKYVGVTIQTVTGTAILFDMAYTALYYDANYAVSFSSITTFALTSATWATIKDKLTKTVSLDAYTPATLSALVDSLTTLKTEVETDTYCGGGCGCGDSSIYTDAVAIYDHLVARGSDGDTVGLDSYVIQLQKIFTCGAYSPAHTGLEIPPYNWGTNTIAPHAPIQFTVGSGAAHAPAAGTTTYNNTTIAGNTSYNIYRQAIADFLVETVDFTYLSTGGFELLPAAGTFQGGERFTLIFF